MKLDRQYKTITFKLYYLSPLSLGGIVFLNSVVTTRRQRGAFSDNYLNNLGKGTLTENTMLGERNSFVGLPGARCRYM